MDKNQATQDTNVSRRRHYGIRIGDIVQSAFGEEPPHFKGAAEVIEYGGFDNNRVKLRYEDGKEGDYVAEWLKIIKRVEDRISKGDYPLQN